MADPARVNEVQKSIREQIMCRTDVDPACDEACGDELDEPCLPHVVAVGDVCEEEVAVVRTGGHGQRDDARVRAAHVGDHAARRPGVKLTIAEHEIGRVAHAGETARGSRRSL